MNNQDVPPKPTSPPTGGLPKVPAGNEDPGRGHSPAAGPAPAPESVTWSQHVPEAKPRMRARTRRALWKAFFVVVLLAVVSGLVWLAIWLNSGQGSQTADAETSGVLETTVTPPATPLPLPREGVPATEYALGDCFADFNPEALASRVVPCDTGHSAQLVAVFRYPEAGDYPGADALKAKALEACQAARLGPAADQYPLNFQRSFPSDTSWGSGDRRVDCYVTADGGNVINASVLP